MSENTIRFPQLDITFNNVGDHIELFGFSVMYYGIIIAVGMLLAGAIILKEGKRVGFKEDDLLDVMLWGMICGIIGARVYYVLFSLDDYAGRWLSVFNIREGGLAVYGGMIGASLAVYVIARKKRLPFLRLLDVLVLGGVVGQICGRWGNFFNREAFGRYYEGRLSMMLPVNSVRQSDAVTKEMMEHIISEGGIDWISVHPTFLYESLWNVGVFLILYFVVRKIKKWDGEIFFSFLMLYGAGRVWIEGLRTDQLLLFSTRLPVSQCLAGLCVAVSTAMLVYKRIDEH